MRATSPEADNTSAGSAPLRLSNGPPLNKRALLANSASSVIARVLNVSVLLWMYQYLLRRIDPVEYSVYAVVVSIMAFSSLLTVTLTSGLGRYLVDAYARRDERRITQIVSTMAPLLAGAAVIVAAAGCTLAAFIDKVFTVAPGHAGDARLMMTLMSLSLALQLSMAPFGLGLYIRQRFVLSSTIQIGQDLLRIALLFILLGGVSARVIWIVVATTSASAAGLIATQIISRRLVPALRFRFSEVRFGLAREVISFGAWNFLGQIAILIHDAANPLILNKLATPLDVTTLHLGAVADQHVRQLSAQATAPLLPAMTTLHALNEEARLQRFYLQGCRYDMWAALLVAVPVMVFAKDLVLLYVGPTFLQAGVVLALLMASYPFFFSQSFLGKIAHAKARIGGFTVLAFLTNIGTVLLALGLVGGLGMGAIGAALATCLMRVVSTLVFIPLSIRLTGVRLTSWLRETVIPGLIPATAAAATCVALRYAFSPSSWLTLGLCAAAGVSVYLVSLIGFAARPDDRALLEKLVASYRKRRSRVGDSPAARGTPDSASASRDGPTN